MGMRAVQNAAGLDPMLLKPSLESPPPVFSFCLPVGRTIICKEGMRSIRVNQNFRMTTSRFEPILHLPHGIQGNACILATVESQNWNFQR